MSAEKDLSDILNINGYNFKSKPYVERILKKHSLQKVIEKEDDIKRDVQRLHSEIQTLVYENYNKFISATDTVKKMKNDFELMETEMEKLVKNMKAITTSATQVSSTLQGTKERMSKLSRNHSLLKKLQHLYKLPEKLKTKIEERNYKKAIDDYLFAKESLQQYGTTRSFQTIQNECDILIDNLKSKLYNIFISDQCSTKQLSEIVDLLVRLNEPIDKLSNIFLNSAEKRLSEHLVHLQDESEHAHLMEFVEKNCEGFINDLCIVLSSFRDLFKECKDLDDFLNKILPKYFRLIQEHFDCNQSINETEILVRALDKFYRKIEAMTCLWHNLDFTLTTNEIIITTAKRQCKSHLKALKNYFIESLGNIRNQLLSILPKSQSYDEAPEFDQNTNLKELLDNLVEMNVQKIRATILDLSFFIREDIVFATKTPFYINFCLENVREDTIVSFIHHLAFVIRNFNSNNDTKCHPIFLIFLSKFCRDFQQNHVQSLLNETDKIFDISKYTNFEHKKELITTEEVLCNNLQDSAQTLINDYVRNQGANIGDILRKSIESRDWLQTVEPRNVRSVMKRLIDELSVTESIVNLLYDEQNLGNVNGGLATTEQSSDSSKKVYSAYQIRSQSSWSTNYELYPTMASNLNRLFGEKIETFTNVEFTKTSIMTGIIKIGLKSFLEIIRLQTFSKFGLQQIQIDTHYLRLYLWRFMNDESLMHTLVDDVLSSAINRSTNAILLDKNVIDIICDSN